MDFYFAGSIRAGRKDVPTYERIITHLKSSGRVFTEHVGDYSLSLEGQTHYSDQYIHDRDLSWLRKSDCVVAETTNPSLGVGYEIACASQWNIPIICLHRNEESSLSAMISGNPLIHIVKYNDLDIALKALDEHLQKLNILGEKNEK